MKNTKIIAVANQKSSGKTTTCVNLGAALSLKGFKVLLIDFDPQESLSNFFGLYNFEKNIADLMLKHINKQPVSIEDYIIRNEVNGIDIIPSNNADMNLFSRVIISKRGQETVLKRLLAKHDTFRSYDYILIDCNASVDVTVDNALSAAEYALIPCWAAPFNFAPLTNTIGQITDIKEELNPDLKIIGILLTFCERTTNCMAACEAVRNRFDDLIFSTTMTRTAKADTSLKEKAAVLSNAKDNKTAIEYRAVADELVSRIGRCE